MARARARVWSDSGEIHISSRIYIHVCMYEYTYICVYINVCICTHIKIFLYVCILGQRCTSVSLYSNIRHDSIAMVI